MNIWQTIYPDFKREEGWGDPDKISGLTLLVMGILRNETGWPIVIHCAYEQTGHADKSEHWRKEEDMATAVDFHFSTSDTVAYQYARVVKILNDYQIDRFVGLGVYPFWNTPGFHIDTRGEQARWGQNESGAYVSIEMALTEVR